MNTNLDVIMLDFEGEYGDDPVEATADAELILRDPTTNRARVAFLRGVRWAAEADNDPDVRSAAKGDPGDDDTSDEDGPASFSAEIDVLARVGVFEALLNEEIDLHRLARLLKSPEGLLEANRRLVANTELDAPAYGPDIEEFVGQEVIRLWKRIPNPSRLLRRKDLRSIGENVVAGAREAGLLALPEDARSLYVTLVQRVRRVRWENATATSKSSLVPSETKDAENLIPLLIAQDRMIAELGGEGPFALAVLWYQLAEDAALSEDEIAELWGESPDIVRDALVYVRSELEVLRSEHETEHNSQ